MNWIPLYKQHKSQKLQTKLDIYCDQVFFFNLVCFFNDSFPLTQLPLDRRLENGDTSRDDMTNCSALVKSEFNPFFLSMCAGS